MNGRFAVVIVVLLLAGGAWLSVFNTQPASEPGDTSDPSWLSTGMVHDLITLWREARVETSGKRAPRGLLRSDASSLREYPAGLVARPGSSFTFDGLATGQNPELSFSVGALFSAPSSNADLPVTFQVHGRPSQTPNSETPAWQQLFETTVTYSGLPVSRDSPPSVPEAIAYTLPLPSDAASRWDVRFSAHQEGLRPQDEPVAWPGWIAPRLTSDPQRVRRDAHPVIRQTIESDLLALFDTAHVAQQRSDLPVELANLDAAKGVTSMGGLRGTLRCASPAVVTWKLTVQPDSMLQFEYGMDTDTGWTLPGNGMSFAIAINETTVWTSRCEAPKLQRDRGWKSGTLDLAPWVGKTVDLSLVTSDLGDPTNDVGGWSRLEIERIRPVKRLLATEAPTVVVLLGDTLRADSLGAFGGNPETTPNLDALANGGLRFALAHAPSSWTWPSTASLFTGLYPTEHGLRDHRDTYLDDDFVTLAECFQDAGYTTAGFVANGLICETSNMDQGFETFTNVPQATAETLNDRVASWLENTDGTARFLYVHYMDPHAPYSPPAPWLPKGTFDPESDLGLIAEVMNAVREGQEDELVVQEFVSNLAERYESEVRYLDSEIGKLLGLLEAHNALDDSLVVFTADHGEEFADHRLLSHGRSLYEETLQVPLSITGFGKSALTPATVERNVLNMDLLATLCSLTGLPLPAQLSHRPLLHRDEAALPSFAQTLHGFDREIEGFTEKLSVIHAEFKLIFTPASGSTELYDLAADALERNNLVEEQPQRVAALMALLEEWRSDTDRPRNHAPSGASEELLKQMQQLGYVER